MYFIEKIRVEKNRTERSVDSTEYIGVNST